VILVTKNTPSCFFLENHTIFPALYPPALKRVLFSWRIHQPIDLFDRELTYKQEHKSNHDCIQLFAPFIFLVRHPLFQLSTGTLSTYFIFFAFFLIVNHETPPFKSFKLQPKTHPNFSANLLSMQLLVGGCPQLSVTAIQLPELQLALDYPARVDGFMITVQAAPVLSKNDSLHLFGSAVHSTWTLLRRRFDGRFAMSYTYSMGIHNFTNYTDRHNRC
jgi:hypothetical protein